MKSESILSGQFPDQPTEVKTSDSGSQLTSTFLLEAGLIIDPASGIPVHDAYVDPCSLVLSKDVPNFKHGADRLTGEVNKLQGPYNFIGTGRSVAWERLIGTLELATGRHRWQLALRTGLRYFPVQIVKEADGFTLEMARTLDAEANIRDNQGEIEDYVAYFKHTDMTEQTAKERGLLRTRKGELAWVIAKYACADLFGLWQAGKVKDAQAAAIARTAPSNPSAQRVGIRSALNGNSAEIVSGVIRHALLVSVGMPKQLDLLGDDDAAIQAYDQQEAVACKFKQEIREQIQAVQGVAKNPAAAHKMQVTFSKSLPARLGELKAELERWEAWPKYPDLAAIVTRTKSIK